MINRVAHKIYTLKSFKIQIKNVDKSSHNKDHLKGMFPQICYLTSPIVSKSFISFKPTFYKNIKHKT